MRALILVDLQNDFVEGGTLAVPGGQELVPLVNRVQAQFEFVVATQDWHPADHASFAANHAGRNVGEVIELGGLPQVLWPVHCVQTTRGADFVPGLNRTHWRGIFPKGTDPAIDSYSGFFDNGKRHATGLGDCLKAHGVQQVYVLGLATDYCVKFTALDAVALGFETKLVQDACRGVDLQPGDVTRALEEMRQAGVHTLQAENIPGKFTYQK
jgi:nicotinamidase/pyrazinamidase